MFAVARITKRQRDGLDREAEVAAHVPTLVARIPAEVSGGHRAACWMGWPLRGRLPDHGHGPLRHRRALAAQLIPWAPWYAAGLHGHPAAALPTLPRSGAADVSRRLLTAMAGRRRYWRMATTGEDQPDRRCRRRCPMDRASL